MPSDIRYFNGIVNVTTYKGDLNGIRLNTHPLVLDYPGIPEQREFFSPKYETEDQVNSRMPDYRTLLYWSPRILTGKQNKKTLNFYTSDLPGHYAAVIMGLSESGDTRHSDSLLLGKKIIIAHTNFYWHHPQLTGRQQIVWNRVQNLTGIRISCRTV